MIVSFLQRLASIGGLSIHRKSSIDKLLSEVEHHRSCTDKLLSDVDQQRSTVDNLFAHRGKLSSLDVEPPEDRSLEDECARLRNELRKHESRQIFYSTAEDYEWFDKTKRIVDRIDCIGEADFAELACWIFASSLSNHRVVHQRIDEGALLWRAVKMSGGPILEVGRAAGGSTLILLGASGKRPVTSIDRAPFHANVADLVFKRPDVSRRLKLYRQTSRERIAESEFGMMFIDADHSYEGVCHDIATFWNQLKPFDGKPPLAAFHDAADNPITFVEPVRDACQELLAEPGVARVVEKWGSMLVLEKTGEIDQDRWFTKEHLAFWEQYATPQHGVLRPTVIRGRLHPSRPINRVADVNLLGEENVEHESWIKRGLTIDRAQLNADNPLRLLRETPDFSEHSIERAVHLNASGLNFSVFLRPHQLRAVRFSILAEDRSPYAQVDFELGERSRIGQVSARKDVNIIDAEFVYRNGYFCCSLAVGFSLPMDAAIFAVKALDSVGGKTVYRGQEERGFFVNLSSVRELL